MEKIRALFVRVRDFILVRQVKLLHAWLLAGLAILYILYAAPLALQTLILVLAKVWIGSLVGYSIDRAVFSRYDASDTVDADRIAALRVASLPGAAWEFRRVACMAACILAVSLGV